MSVYHLYTSTVLAVLQISHLRHSWVWKLISACSPLQNCRQDMSRAWSVSVRLRRWYSLELVTDVMQLIVHIDVHKSPRESAASLS